MSGPHIQFNSLLVYQTFFFFLLNEMLISQKPHTNNQFVFIGTDWNDKYRLNIFVDFCRERAA